MTAADFDPFNTEEWRAKEDAQMELNIAADRWHDFPFSEEAANELRSAIRTYRAASAVWVQQVAGGQPQPAEPATCPKCEHHHANEDLAGICVGCPCEGAAK